MKKDVCRKLATFFLAAALSAVPALAEEILPETFAPPQSAQMQNDPQARTPSPVTNPHTWEQTANPGSSPQKGNPDHPEDLSGTVQIPTYGYIGALTDADLQADGQYQIDVDGLADGAYDLSILADRVIRVAVSVKMYALYLTDGDPNSPDGWDSYVLSSVGKIANTGRNKLGVSLVKTTFTPPGTKSLALLDSGSFRADGADAACSMSLKSGEKQGANPAWLANTVDVGAAQGDSAQPQKLGQIDSGGSAAFAVGGQATRKLFQDFGINGFAYQFDEDLISFLSNTEKDGVPCGFSVLLTFRFTMDSE